LQVRVLPPLLTTRVFPRTGVAAARVSGKDVAVSGKGRTAKPRVDLPIAFAHDDGIVVNFGALTGREATQAEIDRLAHALHQAGAGPDLTITASRRQDYGDGVETVSHQVHVRTAGSEPADIESICREWAVGCAEDRSVDPLA
jgi:hypothetical protein